MTKQAGRGKWGRSESELYAVTHSIYPANLVREGTSHRDEHMQREGWHILYVHWCTRTHPTLVNRIRDIKSRLLHCCKNETHKMNLVIT